NPLHNPVDVIERELTRSGFAKVYGKLFHSFAARPGNYPKNLNFASEIPLYGSGATVGTQEFLAATGVNRGNLPFDVDFISFIGFENHFVDHPNFKKLIQN